MYIYKGRWNYALKTKPYEVWSVEILVKGAWYRLTKILRSDMRTITPLRTESGQPKYCHYNIENNELMIAPTPDRRYKMRVHYLEMKEM